MITKIQHILFNISEYKLMFISTNIIVTAAIYWGDTIPSILKTYHLKKKKENISFNLQVNSTALLFLSLF